MSHFVDCVRVGWYGRRWKGSVNSLNGGIWGSQKNLRVVNCDVCRRGGRGVRAGFCKAKEKEEKEGDKEGG